MKIQLIGLTLAALATLATGCASDSYAAKGAARGAGSGALAGAVGAAATALIFGGDVGDAAARGAVYGGTTGAVMGGMAGADADRRVAAEQRAAREREVQGFRAEIGDDAFNGFVALAECKHGVAMANAREAQKSTKRDFALSGLWVEALAEAEQNGSAPDALLAEIAEKDREVSSPADASARLDEALVRMGEIRREFDLATNCS